MAPTVRMADTIRPTLLGHEVRVGTADRKEFHGWSPRYQIQFFNLALGKHQLRQRTGTDNRGELR